MDRGERLEALLAGVQEAHAAGRPPDTESLCRQHPDLAADIRRRLGALPLVDRAFAGRSRPSLLPSRIGRYRILREISRGGMGVIHLAEDERIRRLVAVKSLPELMVRSEKSRTRLQREAMLAGRLDHPNICTVYETGESDGVPFIAMQYVEGTTLADLVAASTEDGSPSHAVTLPPVKKPHPARRASAERHREFDRVLHLFETTARALHTAHEAGLVHRDVKPANIMVTPAAEPVLLDFGLARDEEPGAPSLTDTGALIGTPAYMSPEQLAGASLRADRRTDIYSLGVTLYECLTLRVPFDAPTRAGIFQRILSTTAEDPRRLNPEVSRDLSVVLATAMEKDRARRYRTALDFAEDLRRVREREPILARPVPSWVRLGRWAHRNPAVASVSGALLLSLVAGLGTSLHLLAGTRTERDAKDAALAETTREKEEKGRALAEKEKALRQASGALAEKDDALRSKDEALAEREAAIEERDGAIEAKTEALEAKEEALAASEKALRHARVLGLVHASAAAQGLDPMESLLLARAAFDRERTLETESRLHEAVMNSLEQGILGRNEGGALSVRFSPSGDRILEARREGTARIWDLQEKPLAVFRGHSDAVLSAQYFPRGDRVFTCSNDGTARVWDTEGRELAVLRGHAGPVHQGEISRAGDLLATASMDGTARIWKLDGREVAVLRGHEGYVRTVRFSPTGDRVATTGHDGTARVWEIGGREVACLRGDGPASAEHTGMMDASFSPNGRRILTLDTAMTATIWDAGGRPIARVGELGTKVAVSEAAFHPRRDRVFLALQNGTVRVLDGDGNRVSEFQTWLPQVGRFAFSATGDRVLAISPAGVARLFTEDGLHLVTLGGGFHTMWDGDLSPDGTLAVTTTADGFGVRLWRTIPSEVASFRGQYLGWVGTGGDRFLLWWSTEDLTIVDIAGRALVRYPPPKSGFLLVCNPEFGGGGFLSLGADRVVRIWDLQGNQRAALPAIGGKESIVAMDANLAAGRVVLAPHCDPVCVFDLAGKQLSSFRVSGNSPYNRAQWVALSPDGQSVAICPEDGTVHICDLDGTDRLVLQHDGMATGARFLPSGDRLLTWGKGNSACLWDLRKKKLLARYPHDGWVIRADVSPAGDRVLTTSVDGTIRLWDTGGQPRLVLNASANTVAFHPSGDRFVTEHPDGTSRIWLLDPQALSDLAKARTMRNFTDGELDLYRDLLGDRVPTPSAQK